MIKTHVIKNVGDEVIEYEFADFPYEEMTGEDYGHIKNKIREGFIQGELLHEDNSTAQRPAIRGWWKIK